MSHEGVIAPWRHWGSTLGVLMAKCAYHATGNQHTFAVNKVDKVVLLPHPASAFLPLFFRNWSSWKNKRGLLFSGSVPWFGLLHEC